jgi:hypothetical protein
VVSSFVSVLRNCVKYSGKTAGSKDETALTERQTSVTYCGVAQVFAECRFFKAPLPLIVTGSAVKLGMKKYKSTCTFDKFSRRACYR